MKKLSLYARPALAAAVLLGAVVGCSTMSTNTIQYIGAPRPAPTDPARIEILQTQPTREHEKLGEVVIDASVNPTPAVQKIETAIRREAARMGADAAVLVHDKMQTVGTTVMGPWWSPTWMPYNERTIVAVAIKYK